MLDLSTIRKNEVERINALDGLRAIAILLVLLYHLTPERDSDHGIKAIIFKLADIGYSGVDLFFVLSGFLITRILLGNHKKNRPLKLFYIRRFLRIIPLYYTSLFFVFLLFPLLTSLYEIPAISLQIPFWIYISNYIGKVDVHFYLGHFWSLAVEMQFYIFWPLVVYCLDNKTITRIILVALCLSLIFRFILVDAGAAWEVTFSWLPFRMDGLLIGSLVAVVFCSGKKISYHYLIIIWSLLIGLGVIIFVIMWYHYASAIFKHPENEIIFVLRVFLPLIFSMFYGLLLYISLQNNWLSNILSTSFLGLISKYSYGIYVIHFMLVPVFMNTIPIHVLQNYVGTKDLAIYCYFMITSSISFLIAVISFHVIEKPFLDLKIRY